MLDVLSRALDALPALLSDEENWFSMDIDYRPPRVERLFHDFENRTARIFLHRINPCDPEAALFHPHPWPSAMKVYRGTYWMRVGSSPGVEPPPHVFEMKVTAGPTTDFRYTMTNPDGWHVVVPLGGPVYTVMVTGLPWQRPIPQVSIDARWQIVPLPASRKRELLEDFREIIHGDRPTRAIRDSVG